MSLDVYIEYAIPINDQDHQVIELYHDNITHNLAKMASEVSEHFYQVLWRPDELFGEEKVSPLKLLPILQEGLAELQAKPSHYRKFNPDNGWGSYDNLINFVQNYITACIKYSNGYVTVWR